MSKQQANSNEDYGQITWNKIFIELCLRAIRKVHIDYGIWGIGQIKAITNEKNESALVKRLALLNNGPGIELAWETTVAAAITQEFINSPFTNGLMVDNQQRYYEISREVTFEWSGKEKIVDIVINRFDHIGNSITYCKIPVLIELKRVYKYKPDFKEGGISNKNQKPNITGITGDITALANIRKALKTKKLKCKDGLEYFKEIKTNNIKDFYTYVLFWGICAPNDKRADSDTLASIIKALEVESNKKVIRWMPLKWDEGNDNLHPGNVTEWLYVCLVSTDNIKGSKNSEPMKLKE